MTSIGYDAGGTFVEWYRDDDGNSGYGDNGAVARWYCDGLRARTLRDQPEPPKGAVWVPVEHRAGHQPEIPGYSHACGYHD